MITFLFLLMKKYLLYILIIGLPIIVGYIYYTYYGSSGSVWSKQCSFHELTGWQCPGCGGQRAFYHLLHGDVLNALRHNLIMIIGLPFFLYMYFILCQRYILKNEKALKYFNFPVRTGYIFITILAIYFILRNIPAWPFIYLSPPQ